MSFHPHPGFHPDRWFGQVHLLLRQLPTTLQSSNGLTLQTCLLKQSHTGVEFAVVLHIAFSPQHTSSPSIYRHICGIRSMCPLLVSRLSPAPSLLCCLPACCNSGSVISSCLVYRHRHDICGIGSTECHQ